MEELLKFCDEHFLDNFFQPYAGANYECLFCGNYPSKGHEKDCATVRYIELKSKI